MNCSCHNKKRCKHTPMVSLHGHSDFSALDGCSKIEDYVKLAKENGHPALAITDHGNMSGTFELFNKCKIHGIKPIVGMEAYLNDNMDKAEEKKYEGTDTHQVILVKNTEGYKNLNHLTYLSFNEGYYRRGRITTEWLLANKKGLIVTTSCLASQMARLLQQGKESEAEERIKLFKREFGDDFYAELQFNEVGIQKDYNHFILKMIKKHDLCPIITNDVHYAKPEDARLQDVLIAINQKKIVDQSGTFKLDARHLYYPTVSDLHDFNKKFGFNYPEHFVDMAIENTLKVADKCNFEFDTTTEKYPQYIPTTDVTDYFKTNKSEEIIFKLAHAKLKWRLNEYRKNGLVKVTDEVIKQYTERLDYELKVIGEKNMLDYFLVIWELGRFCKEEDIWCGIGRGCFLPGSRVKMSDGMYCPIDMIDKGDKVVDAYGKIQTVIDTLIYEVNEEVIELEFEKNKIIKCTKDHRFLTHNRGWVTADSLSLEDDIVEI